jgi:hypothetical protein
LKTPQNLRHQIQRSHRIALLCRARNGRVVGEVGSRPPTRVGTRFLPSGRRGLRPLPALGQEPCSYPRGRSGTYTSPPRKKNTLDKQAIMSYTFKCITTRKFLVRNVLFLLTKKTQIEKKNWIPKSD